MRTFLNAVLSFIGRESLTDEEFASIPSGLAQSYSQESFNALKGILIARGNGSSVKRLEGVFVAKGVNVSGAVASSNIFVGSAL